MSRITALSIGPDRTQSTEHRLGFTTWIIAWPHISMLPPHYLRPASVKLRIKKKDKEEQLRGKLYVSSSRSAILALFKES